VAQAVLEPVACGAGSHVFPLLCGDDLSCVYSRVWRGLVMCLLSCVAQAVLEPVACGEGRRRFGHFAPGGTGGVEVRDGPPEVRGWRLFENHIVDGL
jgi:hypothetical protein